MTCFTRWTVTGRLRCPFPAGALRDSVPTSFLSLHLPALVRLAVRDRGPAGHPGCGTLVGNPQGITLCYSEHRLSGDSMQTQLSLPQTTFPVGTSRIISSIHTCV